MGKIKYKGCYAFDDLGWHQNHSALVVKKAASAAIIDGKNVREFIMNHDEVHDFFLCTKVKRGDGLELQAPVMWGDTLISPKHKVATLQNITRYYVSNKGSKLVKTMKPLKRRGVNVDLILPTWKVSKKHMGGLNKNLKVKTEHEYNNAIKLGYRTKDGGTYTHTGVRESGVDKDWLITPVNSLTSDLHYDINYNYYINEAEKLVNKVL